VRAGAGYAAPGAAMLIGRSRAGAVAVQMDVQDLDQVRAAGPVIGI